MILKMVNLEHLIFKNNEIITDGVIKNEIKKL